MAREGFSHTAALQNIKKIRLLHTAKRIFKNHNYFFITLFHHFLPRVKEIKALWDESTLILHAKSWTTPKKIRHDRFRSPGPVMADLLCSLLFKVP
ncbi:hypothetical protein [Paenibacillus polymyxa]|uniref:hypothetical protein n=1 Tax=Paenibacillus polymyxa TaxID=1406 RepID=UPI0004B3E7C4|nr:hypothetical protein [Paenibacillus polymyxa]